MAEGPHLTKLPETLPQVVSRQLVECDSACASAVDVDMLEYAEALVKCLIIISRYCHIRLFLQHHDSKVYR